MSEDNLEKAIREIREEAVDPVEVESAGARVWEKVHAASAESAKFSAMNLRITASSPELKAAK